MWVNDDFIVKLMYFQLIQLSYLPKKPNHNYYYFIIFNLCNFICFFTQAFNKTGNTSVNIDTKMFGTNIVWYINK